MSELVREVGILRRVWRVIKASVVGAAAPYEVVMPLSKADAGLQETIETVKAAANMAVAEAVDAPPAPAARQNFQFAARMASVALLNQPKSRAGKLKSAAVQNAPARPVRPAKTQPATKKKVARKFVRLANARGYTAPAVAEPTSNVVEFMAHAA